MKFVMLLFDPEGYWESVSEEEMGAAVAEHEAFAAYLRGRGVPFSGEAVKPAGEARTLRPGGAADGPFRPMREDLAGLYVVQCADMAEAEEIAARCPMGAGIEIRPVWG